MKSKYILTKSSNCLHIIGCCPHSKHNCTNSDFYEFFKTEDEVIAKHQNHIRYCKICFKNR